MSNKIDELNVLIHDRNPDVICISETLPKNVDLDFYQPIHIDKFIGFHSTRGRGVSIYVKDDISVEEVTTNSPFEEHIWIKIRINSYKDLLVGCIYRSPNSEASNNMELLGLLEEVSCLGAKYLVVVGDFNYKEVDWINNYVHARADHPATLIFEKINDLFLDQLVTEPTRFREGETANVLDWLIVNCSDLVNGFSLESPLGEKGDHCVMYFNLEIAHSFPLMIDKFNFYKGDYESMNKKLTEIDWDLIFEGNNCEKCWSLFHSILDKLIHKYVPKKKPHNYGCPWITKDLSKILRNKNRSWRLYFKNKTRENWNLFKIQRNLSNRAVRKAKSDFERKIATEIGINPKQFWRYVQSKSDKVLVFPTLIGDDGTSYTDDLSKADHFVHYFSSVFSVEDKSIIPSLGPRNGSGDFDINFITPDQIQKQLEKINVSKAAGPDNIHAKFLIELKFSLCKPLHTIFNKSLQEGSLPTEWKKAIVKPLFKKGSKKNASNYRPVSLTSISCKIMERIIKDKLMDYLETENLLSRHQYGFRSGRSCLTQLLEVMNIWTNLIDQGIPFDCIYTDFAKAFDKVPHIRLINKLKSYGVKGKILNWVSDFLLNRSHQVVINGTKSCSLPVTSGIPQGSVLGPVLFIIYINDLPDVVASSIKIFADDTKIFRAIESAIDISFLQQDLDNLAQWSQKWQLPFNLQKCKIVHFGFNNDRHIYNMENTGLQLTNQERDLGVIVDNELKFSGHIRSAVAKANSRLGLIKRNFTNLSPEVFAPLYKSLVRPILEYCSTIWNPLLLTDGIEIEKVQRRATKLVPGISNFSYQNRLRYLNLDSLQFRRRRADLIQVFKIINGIDTLDRSNFFEFNQISITRGHRFKLLKPRARLNVRKNFFSHRVINDWNALSSKTISCSSINSFKEALSKEWLNHPDKYYDV